MEDPMKIAVTADLHLTTSTDRPERFNAFRDILDQLVQRQINTLVIAGDLFDASFVSVGEVDRVCASPSYREIQVRVIPGNHDSRLSQAAFAAGNVVVHTVPTIESFDREDGAFLFVPYEGKRTLGEKIAEFRDRLSPTRWVLISHADWSEGLRSVNPYEPGVYMPLTRADLSSFEPETVFLGHIHTPLDRGTVHYPGSPCGLDINETGYRCYLIYDTETGDIERVHVNSDVLYFMLDLPVLPVEDELGHLELALKRNIEAWGLNPGDERKVRLRVRVRGYSANRRALGEFLNGALSTYTWYKGEEPDLSEVYLAEEPVRSAVAAQVAAGLQELVWTPDTDHPNKTEILLEALDIVYRGWR
jgi:DNA repair protein SbcD/Mre11